MHETKTVTAYKEALKEKILEIATISFRKNGIKAVKMDDIANALSISKRTLYELYGNKEDLLYDVIKKSYSERLAFIVDYAVNSDDVMDILFQSIRLRFNDFREVNPAFFADMLKYDKIMTFFEEEKRNVQELFIQFLQRGINEGYFKNELNLELICHAQEAMHKYMMGNNLFRQFPAEEVFINFVLVTLRGFCTIKGIKALDGFIDTVKN